MTGEHTEIEKPAPSMVAPSSAENRSPAPASLHDAHELMQRVLLHGDLSKLSAAERNEYYLRTCQSLGLNPLTRPFRYLVLNGQLQLYPARDCTDQLRRKWGISLEVVGQKLDGDLLNVHVRARTPEGRGDEDFGVVSIGNLRGDARANAVMKAITKAKRRCTLSICGLGLTDESELETIPDEDKLVLPDEPEQLELPKSDRSRQLYDAMRQEIEALIESGIDPDAFHQWGKDNANRSMALEGEWFDAMNRYWMEATKRVSDKARSRQFHEDAPTISERAIAAREQVSGRPSRNHPETITE